MKVYTPKTLAERWQCNARHIRRMVDRGDLPGFRLGGKLLRIRGEDVEAYECACSDTEESGPSHGETATETVAALQQARKTAPTPNAS